MKVDYAVDGGKSADGVRICLFEILRAFGSVQKGKII